MIARAPGKLVLSGAYAVLEGSPAIVSAVDRYAIADSTRVADWLTPEVKAAGLQSKPWFDASTLRADDRKIGLGSSAAILVASLAAEYLDSRPHATDQEVAGTVFERARAAHAAVQPLGSGIDVLSSCYGGTLIAQRRDSSLSKTVAVLPTNVHFEVWAAPHAQSTHDMLARLRDFQIRQASLYSRRIADQAAAAEQAANALLAQQSDLLIASLFRQCQALDALGKDAGIPIVTDDLRRLAAVAAKESAAVLPAGAGGGDIAVFAAARPPSTEVRALAARLRHEPLQLKLGARGVHAIRKEC